MTNRRQGSFVDHIDNQRLDSVNQVAVDKAAGFAGQRGDASLDIRIEDNLLRAVQAYSKMQAKAVRKAKESGKDASIKTLEEFLTRGTHLRKRLVDFAKKVNMGQPKSVYFKLDATAEPALAEFLKQLIQPSVLALAFKIHGRDAPSKFHGGFEIVFIGHRVVYKDAGDTALTLLAPSSSKKT